MHGIERRRYEMLKRVEQFGRNHRDVLSTSAAAQQLLAAIDTAIGDLTTSDIQKLTAARAKQGQVKASARRPLIDLLNKGGQLARLLREEGHTLPACDPPSSKSDQTLLTAGRQLAETAAQFATEFGEHELPADRITAAVTAFEATVQARNNACSAHAVAMARIKRVLRAAVRQARRLDLIVTAKLAGDDALTDWQVARRVDEPRARKRKEGGTEPAPETAPAAPSTPSENSPPAVAA